MLTYEDAKSEVFTQKQYVNSLKSNESLLKKLHHDSIYQNLIFIGCSLDDEIDLLACSSENEIGKAKYFCTIKEPSPLEQFKNEKYGITMVWILRFMSAKTVFSLYTHPADKKNSGIWKEYNQLKMV